MNKKIYTFTLEDDEYPSDIVVNNIRIIARLLYEEIKVQDYESDNPILIQSNMIQENYLSLISKDVYCQYKFESEGSRLEYYMFEPFMISERTFGITVNDGTIDEEQLLGLLDKVKKLIKCDYNFKINSFIYTGKNRIDESKRKKAMDEALEVLNNNKNNNGSLVKKLIPTMFFTKVVRG